MTLPAVIYQAPYEKKQVERLKRYCRELDGTELIVIDTAQPEGVKYPEITTWAYKQACKEMKGKAFIWLESDSPPLVAGWREALTAEYKRVEKPFLLPARYNPPWDTATGIGVHPPDADEIVPDEIPGEAFDGWLYKNRPEMIGGTELIRHSYARYSDRGDAYLHEFPQDMHIIGQEAVLFHKDSTLQLLDILMPGKGFKVELHNSSTAGDLGDCVAMLAILQHKGDQHMVYLRDNSMTAGIERRIDVIRPLLEAQPYIESVQIWRRQNIQWDSAGFRPNWHTGTQNLAECHARHALDTKFIPTLPDFSKPWLTVEADKKWEGRVVVNRSARYRNEYFPWHAVVHHYGSKLVFLGMPEEHQDFCSQFGNIEYHPTKDLLEAARIIKSSSLLIGNQSSLMVIAEGLKHPRIQETCLWIPDCIYPSATNAQYCANGDVILPDVDGSGVLDFKRDLLPEANTQNVPRGGWQYPGLPNGMSHLSVQVSGLRKIAPHLSPQEARDMIIRHNIQRLPRFFDSRGVDSRFSRFRLAMQNYGYSNT